LDAELLLGIDLLQDLGLTNHPRIHWGPGIRTSTVTGTPFMCFTIRTDSVIRALKVQISELTSVSVMRYCYMIHHPY